MRICIITYERRVRMKHTSHPVGEIFHGCGACDQMLEVGAYVMLAMVVVVAVVCGVNYLREWSVTRAGKRRRRTMIQYRWRKN